MFNFTKFVQILLVVFIIIATDVCTFICICMLYVISNYYVRNWWEWMLDLHHTYNHPLFMLHNDDITTSDFDGPHDNGGDEDRNVGVDV
ncbi:unnamed protein product [Adineta steineri]|uniref:Uncharacterized protein n=1 Tax=Adineta steineri TaxID=433720 RepID=A0A815F1H2_9BILA|nr:unnamed protein product [Adineta steineri]CAF3832567.1 unnamed protein product [Adineta steineri]